MVDAITQLLEYKELVSLILLFSAVYWRLDKRLSTLEGWCKPFFGKMYEEAVDRAIR